MGQGNPRNGNLWGPKLSMSAHCQPVCLACADSENVPLGQLRDRPWFNRPRLRSAMVNSSRGDNFLESEWSSNDQIGEEQQCEREDLHYWLKDITDTEGPPTSLSFPTPRQEGGGKGQWTSPFFELLAPSSCYSLSRALSLDLAGQAQPK